MGFFSEVKKFAKESKAAAEKKKTEQYKAELAGFKQQHTLMKAKASALKEQHKAAVLEQKLGKLTPEKKQSQGFSMGGSIGLGGGTQKKRSIFLGNQRIG